MYNDEEEDLSFIQRHPGLVLLVIVLVVAPVIYFAARNMMNSHPSSSHEDEVMIRLPPPPPPPLKPRPTPTPDQQPTPDEPQKMVEQQPVQNEHKEAPKPQAPPSLGTSITGPGGGPDMGLSSGLGGGGGYGDGGGGSKFGWYASEVQSRVADALRSNPQTRTASMDIKVRIWADSTGRVTKVRIQGSTGDPALDATLQNEVLTGLQLSDAPPADMPMPIVMRLSAQRPH
jgi:protein TonB